jgi:hypothetical protein
LTKRKFKKRGSLLGIVLYKLKKCGVGLGLISEENMHIDASYLRDNWFKGISFCPSLLSCTSNKVSKIPLLKFTF